MAAMLMAWYMSGYHTGFYVVCRGARGKWDGWGEGPVPPPRDLTLLCAPGPAGRAGGGCRAPPEAGTQAEAAPAQLGGQVGLGVRRGQDPPPCAPWQGSHITALLGGDMGGTWQGLWDMKGLHRDARGTHGDMGGAGIPHHLFPAAHPCLLLSSWIGPPLPRRRGSTTLPLSPRLRGSWLQGRGAAAFLRPSWLCIRAFLGGLQHPRCPHSVPPLSPPLE